MIEMKRSAVTEKWIHSFAVTDVCLHPRKFTVYKVTSVVCISPFNSLRDNKI